MVWWDAVFSGNVGARYLCSPAVGCTVVHQVVSGVATVSHGELGQGTSRGTEKAEKRPRNYFEIWSCNFAQTADSEQEEGGRAARGEVVEYLLELRLEGSVADRRHPGGCVLRSAAPVLSPRLNTGLGIRSRTGKCSSGRCLPVHHLRHAW